MLAEEEARKLLDMLCVQLGFCIPPEDYQGISRHPPSAVGSFTDAVFLAEGLDPSTADRHLYRQVRDTIADAFSKAESGY